MLRRSLLLTLYLCLSGSACADQRPVDAIRTVSGVAQTSPAVQQAWRELAGSPPERMVEILAGMQGANPTAQNWLRMAADAIAERALAAGKALPAEQLRDFLEDLDQAPRARRAAYEWLVKVDATTADAYLPQMLDDPSIELRYDAIAQLLESAGKEGIAEEEKREILKSALASALDQQQLEKCKEELETLGDKVDLAEVMGFLLEWRVIGPFDNTGESGFEPAHLPETKTDFDRSYAGKNGAVEWKLTKAEGALGELDLTESLGPEKGAVAYAVAFFFSDEAREAELRYTTPNASKVWLNGQLAASHEVYHAGTPLDQYRARVSIMKGRNTVLVKVCQNEQTDPWAQDWALKLRFTDLLGKGLHSSDNPAKVEPIADPSGIFTY